MPRMGTRKKDKRKSDSGGLYALWAPCELKSIQKFIEFE